MKIAVVGAGYVGLSISTFLSIKHDVYLVDIIEDKVNMINNRISPIHDNFIIEYFKEKELSLKATLDYKEAFLKASFVIVCTPTNYDEDRNFFDTSSVEDIISKVYDLEESPTIVIKSTIPVGFVNQMREKYPSLKIFFSPEFLREGTALYDILYPSRIIVGDKGKDAKLFAKIMKESALRKRVPVLFMDSMEAEAVKLFSNTYLALRISYFNELDTYAEIRHLNTKDIIEGVCLDPRIGNHYNNPSFGYGGYCLPKDTKQLLANYEDVPENLIEAIVKSNDTRKKHIADEIVKRKPNVVGVYRLIMKSSSDNFRASAIIGVIDLLKEQGVNIMIYEPNIKVNTFNGFEVVHDLKLFKETSDLIIVNRLDDQLEDVKDRIYTRDIFREN